MKQLYRKRIRILGLYLTMFILGMVAHKLIGDLALWMSIPVALIWYFVFEQVRYETEFNLLETKKHSTS